MMSLMDSPFGPRGEMACTCSVDTVCFVYKVGGPKIAMTNKYSQINECGLTLFRLGLSA